MQSTPLLFVSASESIKIWNENAEQLNILDSCTSKFSFKDVAWNYNNSILAGATFGSGIVLYDLQSDVTEGHEIPESRGQTSVCFGGGKTELYSSGANGDISVWNCNTGKLSKTFHSSHKCPVRRLTRLKNGNVVSACSEGELVIWHADSGTIGALLKSLKSKSVRGLEYSKYDRSMLCTTSDDGYVCVWDIEKEIQSHTFAHHAAPAMDLSFSTINSLLLASCGLDKKVIFYDVNSNSLVKTFMCGYPLTSICFLSNGMHVCVGTCLGSILQYDLRRDSKPLNTMQAHSTSVQRLVLQSLNERKRSSKVKPRNSTHQRKCTHGKDEQKYLSEVPAETEEESQSLIEHDSIGSFCEEIFSPVANVLKNMQNDPFGQSTEKVQQKRKGNAQHSKRKPINLATPATQHPPPVSQKSSWGGSEFSHVTIGSFFAEDEISDPEIPRRTRQDNLKTSTLETSTPQYQHELVGNTVCDLIERHEDNMRGELRHLHIQVVKMFADLGDRMTVLAEQCSVNPLLLKEIERLRSENNRLSHRF